MLIEVIGHEKLLMQFSGFDYTIALEICTKNPNGVFMKYLLKCFALFIIKFEYKITVRGYHLVDFVMNCSNCKHVVCCKNKMEGISIISQSLSNIFSLIVFVFCVQFRQKKQLNFSLRRNVFLGFKPVRSTINQFDTIWVEKFLKILLLLQVKIYIH